MGSIADWAAVIVAMAAVVVAVASIKVTRDTNERQLEHARRMALLDAKRETYAEILQVLGNPWPWDGGDEFRESFATWFLIPGRLRMVNAPREVRTLAGMSIDVSIFVKASKKSYNAAVSSASTEVVLLLERCMREDLEGDTILPDVRRGIEDLRTKHSEWLGPEQRQRVFFD